ncbi:MAG: MATE family efflux transporter [Bacteroidales bacterium]|nr:MATE family efflux transporter [Bacteroidales bacterium]
MNRKILSLAIPSIVANITTPLLGLVDTAITGHMGSAVYIGAIAVGGVMFNMLYWLFGFLRGGTSGLAAQAYGAGDRDASDMVLYRSLAVAATVGLAMILLQWPLGYILRSFVDSDPATARLADRYFSILIYGAPAVLATYALSGWFLGMQNSRMLMVTSIVINTVNIVASLAFVYGLGWQIEGVACGTLIAQWTGLAVGVLLLRRYRLHRPAIGDILRGGELKRFFRVNFDMMLRTVCLIAVTVWFTRAGASQGAVILAVNTLLMQLFLLFSYMMDGFAYAGEALVGRFTGSRDIASLHLCVKRLFMWGAIWAGLFTALYFCGGEGFLKILSSDRDVIAASSDYYLWAVSVPFAGFAAFAWDGVFIGATLTRQLLVSMAGAMAVFFIIYLTLFRSMGNHALWLAFVSYLFARGAIQTWLYYNHKWE